MYTDKLDTTCAADIARSRAERTFLAWLRTSLAFASIGIAITQLFRLNTTIQEREGRTVSDSNSKALHLRQLGKPLGATFLGIAMVVLIVGGRRYFESQVRAISSSQCLPVSRGLKRQLNDRIWVASGGGWTHMALYLFHWFIDFSQ